MLPLPKCQLTAVFGPVASGKTHLIKKWLTTENRVVVFDTTGEMVGLPSMEEISSSPAALYKRIKANPYYYRIAYEPGLNLELDFREVVKTLWFQNQDKLLVCDEWHRLAPVEGVSLTVEMVLRFARHDKMGFVGASQRIADVSKLFTSACRMTVLFRTQEARDLVAIDDRWGCADLVTGLRPLIYDDSKGVTRQIPQAVVIMLGTPPRVYDFKAEKFIGTEDEKDGDNSEDTEMSKLP